VWNAAEVHFVASGVFEVLRVDVLRKTQQPSRSESITDVVGQLYSVRGLARNAFNQHFVLIRDPRAESAD
jgi:hypothetical protein